MKHQFRLPNNELVDTSICTSESPCYFCEVQLQFIDAEELDKIEKQSRARKRSFSTMKFFTSRIASGQNDVHLGPVFYKKQRVDNCSRIHYDGKPEMKGELITESFHA